MIDFDLVTFAYSGAPTRPVLHDFSLNIAAGEQVAVIGGNGSGKTTLGLLLCGILKPSSGKITIAGHAPIPGGDGRRIGFLFQDPDNGLVATTVEREVAFSLENRNLNSALIRPVVDRTLDRFGLEPYRRRLVWHLSGGEKQRLALAGLLADRADILFLDEPESFLDWAGAERLSETLHELRQSDSQLTIIRITQFAQVADRYPRIILMGRGKVLKDGPPEEVFGDEAILTEAGLRPPLRFLKPRSAPSQPAVRSGLEFRGKTRLAIEKLSFRFEAEDTAFRIEDLSLTIDGGEIVALVGRSGSGKSTLAQLICGLYRPDSGTIRFEPASARAVMSFQQPERQFFLDTAFDEVAYGIRKAFDKGPALEQAVRRSMQICGLDFDLFSRRDPNSLSGGEARRLAFAIVVALGAKLIIFDEPTCALDEAGISAFRKLAGELQRAGTAVVIISHNGDIVAELADRVILMDGGRVIHESEPIPFFASAESKGILAVPEVISYQRERFGAVRSTRVADIFDVAEFSA